ncbi:MAG: hypothetical protein HY060_06700 [Proteobacteria bacterium]|nr:hypothetical protein [Pseudomonadota bacterium]
MSQGRRFLLLLAVGYGLVGCAGAAFVSPNDAQYARSGAPRAGEPATPQGGGYAPLGGGVGGSSSSGGM